MRGCSGAPATAIWWPSTPAAGGRCAEFGTGGRVDLMDGLPRAVRGTRDYLNALTYSVQSPPIVVGDVVITPASISSLVSEKEQIPGWIRGHDVRTGRLLWTFHTVPQPGEPGHDSWKDDSWRDAGKVTVWTAMSADAELGYVYLPTNTVAPDFYGGHRPGDNLYAESLVCLDAKTGRRVWQLPDGAPRPVGLRQPGGAEPARRHRRRPAREGGGAGQQAGVRLHVRPGHRDAAVADRRAAGAALRRARRAGLADAAVPDPAAAVRVPGRERGRSGGFHPAAARPRRWRRSRSSGAARCSRRRRCRAPSSVRAPWAGPTGAAPRSIPRPACCTCRRATASA